VAGGQVSGAEGVFVDVQVGDELGQCRAWQPRGGCCLPHPGDACRVAFGEAAGAARVSSASRTPV